MWMCACVYAERQAAQFRRCDARFAGELVSVHDDELVRVDDDGGTQGEHVCRVQVASRAAVAEALEEDATLEPRVLDLQCVRAGGEWGELHCVLWRQATPNGSCRSRDKTKRTGGS